MKRGGGHRGGSFGGGRSSGGSFRGGGMRSSRMSRSSRRYHHHHHRRRYRPYYGRPYYGRRGYYGRPYRSGSGIIGLIVFLFIVMLIATIFIAGAASSTTNHTIELAPGTSFAVSYSSFSDSGVKIDVINGRMETYIFNGEPAKSQTVSKSYNYSGTLDSNDYEYAGLSLTDGSYASVTWVASSPVNYYAIRGEQNLVKWEGGDNTHFYDNYGDTGSHTLTVSKSDNYYFAVESLTPNNAYTMNIDLTIPVHDLTGSKSQFSGSQTLSGSDVNGDTMVFYNPTSDDARAHVSIESAFSFGVVFITIMALTIGGLYLLYKRAKPKASQNTSTGSSSGGQVGAKEEIQQTLLNRNNTASQFKTRPQAKYCDTCGSAVLPNSKFCIECGQKI